MLLGLEMRLIARELTGSAWSPAILGAAAVTVVIVALRLAWTQFVFPLSRYLPGRHVAFDHLHWRERLAIGWSGMRGAISLAIVLSLPVSAPGLPPERRGERFFVTGAVVFITLLGCATTLPGLLRRLGMAESDRVRIEYQEARKTVVEAALARLDELIENGEVDDRTGRTFHQLYEDLLDQIRTESDEDPDVEVTDSFGLRRELVRTQRERLRRLYAKGKISAEVLRAVDRWLDLEDPDIREVG